MGKFRNSNIHINMMCRKLFALALFSMMQAVLMIQAERKVSPTICKHFPDADICDNAEERSLWHKIKHGVEKVLDKVGHEADKVVHGAEKGAKEVGHEAGKVVHGVEKGAKDVGHEAGKVVDKIKPGFEKVVNKTKHGVEKGWDKVLKPGMEKVLDKVLDSVKDKVKDEAGKGVDKALDEVKNVLKGKGNIGQELGELGEELLPDLGELVPLVAVRMQEERKVSPTICKHFPYADICDNAEDRRGHLWHKIKHGVEKVGHDIAKGAELLVAPELELI